MEEASQAQEAVNMTKFAEHAYVDVMAKKRMKRAGSKLRSMSKHYFSQVSEKKGWRRK